METWALFPGCLVLQRMPQYEKATIRVLRELDVRLENIPRAACCGAPLESFTDRWVHLSAYNLALAEEMGRDLVTLCGNCASTLSRAGAALAEPALRAEVNQTLKGLGLRFTGEARVQHLIRLLSEHCEKLREKVTRRLHLRVAVTHPCQALRPASVMGFDDPLHPEAMRRLVELTGAEVIDYPGENECCGSTLYLAHEGLGLAAGTRKLASAADADVLVDACGNCQLLLERFQGLLTQDSGLGRTAVLTLPQLLGLALGAEGEELGIGAATEAALLGART